jgi:hypothetical protein
MLASEQELETVTVPELVPEMVSEMVSEMDPGWANRHQVC